MELVNIAAIEIPRVGCTSPRNRHLPSQSHSEFCVVAGGSDEELKKLLISIGARLGDDVGILDQLHAVKQNCLSGSSPEQVSWVFPVGGGYARDVEYARTSVFPALQTGGRYFRLDEVGSVTTNAA